MKKVLVIAVLLVAVLIFFGCELTGSGIGDTDYKYNESNYITINGLTSNEKCMVLICSTLPSVTSVQNGTGIVATSSPVSIGNTSSHIFWLGTGGYFSPWSGTGTYYVVLVTGENGGNGVYRYNTTVVFSAAGRHQRITVTSSNTTFLF